MSQAHLYLDVDMSDIVPEYDVPDDVPEWQWIEQNARWAHLGNGEEGGVWEFLVHADCGAFEDVPENLKSVFNKAKNQGCIWIMFNQG